MSDLEPIAPRYVVRPRRRASPIWLVVAALAALLMLPIFVNSYTQYIVNTILLYSLVGLGFNIVLGYLGQLAFANAAFFGVGAYVSTLAAARLGIPFWISLLPCGVFGGMVGLLVALPALRLERYYLAIVTLTMGELLRWAYIHTDAITGGSSGVAVPDPIVFGHALTTDAQKYYVCLAVTVSLYWITRNLLRSRLGRALNAVRQNELAAASLGLSPVRVKMIAFAWSGFIVAIAGALFSIVLGRITPDSFDLTQLLLHFAIVMIGGLGSLAGSLIGAVLLTAAPELLRNVAGVQEIAFAMLLILVLLLMPQGLSGLLTRYVPALRDRFFGEEP